MKEAVCSLQRFILMKDKIKLLGIEFLYMLSVLIVSTIANPIQFLGKKEISMESEAAGFGIDYSYNPVAYIAGALLFAGFAGFTYHKWYKQFADQTLKCGWKFTAFYILNALILSGVMFYVLLIEVLIILGFDNNILSELLQFITVFCWPVLFFVFMIAIMIPPVIKKKK